MTQLYKDNITGKSMRLIRDYGTTGMFMIVDAHGQDTTRTCSWLTGGRAPNVAVCFTDDVKKI